MDAGNPTRRSFIAGAALGSVALAARSLRGAALLEAGAVGPAPSLPQPGQAAARFTFVQFHNQTAASSLHRRLVDMWAAIRTETTGRVDTQVHPENNKTPGSDPAVLKMLIAGDLQFFTVMGGILGNVVPAAEVQQMPFLFRSAGHAQQAMDGALGAYLREEMAAKGIFGFPVGAFDNGMRQIAGSKRPIARPADLAGIRMRVPAGAMVADTFKALGAQPITINSDGIYEALKTDRVDAQENPLALLELFRIYEVVRYVSMTNHMWSGFNLLAHLPTWMRLPDDIKAVIERNAAKYVRLQRQDQEQMNSALRQTLARRGLLFNEIEAAAFRAQLSGVYATWKDRLGSRCWSLLDAATRARA